MGSRFFYIMHSEKKKSVWKQNQEKHFFLGSYSLLIPFKQINREEMPFPFLPVTDMKRVCFLHLCCQVFLTWLSITHYCANKLILYVSAPTGCNKTLLYIRIHQNSGKLGLVCQIISGIIHLYHSSGGFSAGTSQKKSFSSCACVHSTIQ